jgi:hypothetical protein
VLVVASAARDGKNGWFAETLNSSLSQLEGHRCGCQGGDELPGRLITGNCVFTRPARQGRLSVAYPSALGRYGVVLAREGRKVGTPLNSRDVSSEYCRRKKGIVVERLDRYDAGENGWREAVVQDTRSAPVTDVVAFRIDFADWLGRLSRRKRRIAELLALGNRAKAVSQRFRVSEARTAQLRRELAASWAAFGGENGSTGRVDPVAA